MNKEQLLKELRKQDFSEQILDAFEKIKRENFIPENLKSFAYNNEPLPIANGATISQPYTIAFMLTLLELDKLTNADNEKLLTDISNDKLVTDKTNKQEGSSKYEKPSLSKSQKFSINNNGNNKIIELLSKHEKTSSQNAEEYKITNKNKIKILEIGSGSGYVLALINEILKRSRIKNYEIYGIERIKELVKSSRKIFNENKNIKIIERDGSKGLPEKKPFDRILVSAAFEKVPENLFNQLKNNGILVTPVKNSIFQIKKENDKIYKKEFPGFVFVPVIED